MRGSVVQKNGRAGWYVIIEDRDPVTGKRHRRWHSGYRTKAEAEDACVDLVAAKKKGLYVRGNSVTVADFLEDMWLPSIKEHVQPSTFETYAMQARAYVIPRIGDVQLQDVTGAALERLYSDLHKDGRRRGGGPLAAKTVRNIAGMLHRTFGDACRWRLLARNPADDAKPPRTVRHLPATWTGAEAKTFLEHAAVDDPDSYPLAVLLLTTGLRRSEALGMTWRSCDLDAGTLEVSQVAVFVGGEVVLRGETKTSNSRRLVELDIATVEVLRGHRRRLLERRMVAGPAWQDLDLMFCRDDGSPIRPDWLTRWAKQQAQAAGVPAIGVHGMRHTWATLALKAQVHPKVVAERLGHSTVQTTLDRYSHVMPGMQREAADRVAAAVLGRHPVDKR